MKTINDTVMQTVLANSYRNYHAKGLDYLCFRRAAAMTLKVYFFDNPAFEAGQVVNPHTHRYNSQTAVIRGSVTNMIWRDAVADDDAPRTWDRFLFNTPLLGGVGFVYVGPAALQLDNALIYGPGHAFRSGFDVIHTLANVQPGTIIAQEQYRAVLAPGLPTTTFVPAKALGKPGSTMPGLSGLYDRFTADQAMVRLRQLEQAQPGAMAWLQGST